MTVRNHLFYPWANMLSLSLSLPLSLSPSLLPSLSLSLPLSLSPSLPLSLSLSLSRTVAGEFSFYREEPIFVKQTLHCVASFKMT